jgi:hypothetical protein
MALTLANHRRWIAESCGPKLPLAFLRAENISVAKLTIPSYAPEIE